MALRDTILMMALDRDNDGDSGAIFGNGFERAGKTAEALTIIDQLTSEGLIEPITIYALTDAGRKALAESQ